MGSLYQYLLDCEVIMRGWIVKHTCIQSPFFVSKIGSLKKSCCTSLFFSVTISTWPYTNRQSSGCSTITFRSWNLSFMSQQNSYLWKAYCAYSLILSAISYHPKHFWAWLIFEQISTYEQTTTYSLLRVLIREEGHVEPCDRLCATSQIKPQNF